MVNLLLDLAHEELTDLGDALVANLLYVRLQALSLTEKARLYLLLDHFSLLVFWLLGLSELE